MSRTVRTIYLLLVIILYSFQIKSQDVGAIGKGQALKVNGGIAMNSIFYTSNGPATRSPFSFFINGNINFNLYGWSVPLTFAYTNHTFSYTQPFNQYSLNPTYKWLTTHIGWTSMNFSPYTLNGHQFFGVGVEAAPPGRLHYSAMYGRLQKAIGIDTAHPEYLPAYKRMGYGIKIEYAGDNYNLGINLFRAKDDINSVRAIPDSLQVVPQENIAIGFTGGFTIYKHITFTGEYATSQMTRDIRSPLAEHGAFNVTNPFIRNRTSTGIYHAYKAGINYNVQSFTLGIGYERVDPEYATLGAYYFTNDFQNITVNFSQSIFNHKVTIGGNAGVQNDDLAHKKISNMRRLVGSLNVNYTASDRLQFDASYGNFQSFTNIKPQFAVVNQLTPYDNLDTLNYVQISQNANLNMNYQLAGNKKRRQSLNVNFSYQQATEKQAGHADTTGGTKFYNTNAGYNLSLVPTATTVTVALNLSYSVLPGNNSLAWGPTLAVGQAFFNKKIKTRLSASYNTSANNGATQMSVVNLRGSAGYTWKRKHNFNLSVVSLFRNNMRAQTSSPAHLFDLTTTAGYSYSF
ncbi:hypothetical protein SAMN05518672_1026 [Chitinophaga sp. CF118]|uniref:hypothetical protein n=1 Tax=Chitinophaga sp. CF118 TaxID=1884367 RepID=UPI0008EAD65B|nr:hypothetical protein [Chitinophaga sp. CF118]SFD45192.1 hypothetical protein SAMN05518672_1026 [Chitinophaga sp. CF118]